MNSNLLKSKIIAAGMTQKELAARMGISKNTVTAKISGKSRLRVDEVDLMCAILDIHDFAERANIFLHASSQKRDDVISGK